MIAALRQLGVRVEVGRAVLVGLGVGVSTHGMWSDRMASWKDGAPKITGI